MRGFNSIDKLTKAQCQQLLQNDVDIDFREDVQNRLNEIIEDEHRQETSAFQKCSSIEDYRRFLSRYTESAYKSQALEKIDILTYRSLCGSKSGCEKYLEKFPHGHYALAAKEKIQKVKRRRIITVIIFIIIIIALILGYHPAGDLYIGEAVKTEKLCKSPFSFRVNIISSRCLSIPVLAVSPLSDSKSISFKKEGGTQVIPISSNADSENIEIISNNSWIIAQKISGGKVKIIVGKNETASRSGSITIKAWNTLFGIRTTSSEGTIYIEQDAGYASYLSVSNDELDFSQNGGSKTISVSSDGFWTIDTSTSSWAHLTINGNNISIVVDPNNDEDRTDWFSLKSGSRSCRVNISQSGIPATYLRLEDFEITASKEGTGEGKCYPVKYFTDGSTVKAYTNSDWMTVNVIKSSSRIEIEVKSNSGAMRKGNVYVKASGYEKIIEVTQRGKTTSLSLDYSSWTFDTDSDYDYFTVYCDGEETISTSTSANWISLSFSSSNKLKISVSSNSGSQRTGTVYVKSGNQSTSITIKQKGYHNCPKCYNWMAGYSTGQIWGQIGFYFGPIYGWITCDECGGSGRIKD